jgi:SEC-C motif-containing protein
LQKAPTAESLMRSRYSAHVLQAIDYLWETWDKAQRHRSSREEIRAWAVTCEWLGLEIIATDKGGDADSQGLVSFIARFRQGSQTHEHREISLFKRVSGHWVYVDHA